MTSNMPLAFSIAFLFEDETLPFCFQTSWSACLDGQIGIESTDGGILTQVSSGLSHLHIMIKQPLIQIHLLKTFVKILRKDVMAELVDITDPCKTEENRNRTNRQVFEALR